MNNIRITGKIKRISTKYSNHLWMQIDDTVAPQKSLLFSVNVFGDNAKQWRNKIALEDIVTIKGNVASIKPNKYGDMIEIYNPEIIGAIRENVTRVDLTPDKDEENI